MVEKQHLLQESLSKGAEKRDEIQVYYVGDDEYCSVEVPLLCDSKIHTQKLEGCCRICRIHFSLET